MATEFKLPELGENITSGTVVKIAVAVGDTVKKDQTLVEVETDKASIDVPSNVEGTVTAILIKEGTQIKIGQTLLTIETGVMAKTTARVPTELPKEAPKKETKKEPPLLTKAEPAQTLPTSQPSMVELVELRRQVAAAPSVRRFAREIGIDVFQVPGSGPKGRISIEDIKAYSKKMNSQRIAGGPSTTSVGQRDLPDFSKWGDIERKPMNNIRKKTAEHLSYCWQTIPHVTQFGKADITELEKLRKRYSTPERKLTITPFLLKVIASGLKAFPQFNASVDMQKNEIVYKKYFHIGVAVDTERGLLVPVVRDVEKKSIMQLTQELNEIAERARNKKTTLEEMQGASFTLTNLGGIGGTAFTPIVNWPDVAILGVSRAEWEPVYVEKQFVPRLMLPLSLSYDHRLIDGADGARFLTWVADAIQQPFLMDLTG